MLCDGGSHTIHEGRQTEFTLHSSVSCSDILREIQQAQMETSPSKRKLLD